MLFLPTSSNHGVGSRFNFQLRMAHSLHEQCEYERNHASRYADGKVVPVKGRHLKRVK